MTSRLSEIHGNGQIHGEVVADYDRTDDQSKEDDQKDEVEDRVADYTSLAESRLLDGVDRWSNLATG